MNIQNAEPPKRPHKNLEEFRQKSIGIYKFREDVGFWPCLKCNSYGRIYDPNDPPCPIEGNKLRNRIKCQLCNGTGRGDRRVLVEEYRNDIREWRVRLNRWRADFKAWKQLRLTSEQIRVLREFGFPKASKPRRA